MQVPESYADFLRQVTADLASGDARKVASYLAPGFTENHVKLFADNIFDKRCGKLEAQLDFLKGVFADLRAKIETYVGLVPMAAYEDSDEERFLDWLESTEDPSPEQSDYLAWMRGRQALDARARAEPFAHRRFQELLSLAPVLASDLGREESIQVLVNPVRARVNFQTGVFLEGSQDPPVDALLVCAGGEVRTNLLEPPAWQALGQLGRLQPCPLARWRRRFGVRAPAAVALCRQLAALGIVAFCGRLVPATGTEPGERGMVPPRACKASADQFDSNRSFRASRPATPPGLRGSEMAETAWDSGGAGEGDVGSPAGTSTLCAALKPYRARIGLAYLLLAVENVLRLLQPLALAAAVNRLLNGSAVGLVWFAGQHAVHVAVTAGRRFYDARTFTAAYTALVTALVQRQQRGGVELSRIAARSALSRELVQFLESGLPAFVEAAFSVTGAFFLLGLYDPLLVACCLALLIPAGVLNRRYARRSAALNRAMNDELEREVDSIRAGTEEAVTGHYTGVARLRVRCADAQTWNVSLMDLFVLGLMVGSVIRICNVAAMQPGDIMAIYRYVIIFVVGMDAVPGTVGQLVRLRDIVHRIRGEDKPTRGESPEAPAGRLEAE